MEQELHIYSVTLSRCKTLKSFINKKLSSACHSNHPYIVLDFWTESDKKIAKREQEMYLKLDSEAGNVANAMVISL